MDSLLQTAATVAPGDSAMLQSLRSGRWALYWRHCGKGISELPPLAVAAADALAAMAAASTAPRWADTDADNADRLAAAIREGRVLITDQTVC